MSALRDALEELFAFMEKSDHAPPTRDVMLLEITSDLCTDEIGRFRVKRSDLKAVTAFEARFDEILAAGLPWINVSCYGVDLENLVVGVEVPKGGTGSSSRTSVNYSGPPNSVSAQGWTASNTLVFEEEN